MFVQLVHANLDHTSTQTLVPVITSAKKVNVTQTAGCLPKLISSSGQTEYASKTSWQSSMAIWLSCGQ